MSENSDELYEAQLEELTAKFGIAPRGAGERAELVATLRAVDREKLRASGLERVFVVGFRLQPTPLEKSVARAQGRPAPAPAHGVTVEDPLGGCSYDVVLNDTHDDLAYLACRPHSPRSLRDVERLTEPELVMAAAAFVADYPSAPTGHGEFFVHPSVTTAGESSRLSASPSLDYVGDVIRIAHRVDDPRVSARRVLQARTGKSASTVDRLMREARKQDPTLPKDTRGRRPKSDTKGKK
jgi:hypothetical protein